MDRKYVVLDLGGTFLKFAVMTEGGDFVEQGKVPTNTQSEEELRASLRQVRESLNVGDFEGVAVSMPGRINTDKGVAHTGGAFRWIHDLNAAALFGEAFDNKPTVVANDGKCAALAESWLGALSDVDSGCVLVLGTGIGGGIVLNNEVWMGATGGAGELSLFVTDHDAVKNEGLSFSNVRAMWTGRVSASSICGQYALAKNIDHADGIMLFDAYDAGDPDAISVLNEFGRQVAAGILSLQSVLDLERYAIGGGISARPETTSIIAKAVDGLFDQGASFLPFGKPEVVPCKFGNEANLIGALAFHRRYVK